MSRSCSSYVISSVKATSSNWIKMPCVESGVYRVGWCSSNIIKDHNGERALWHLAHWICRYKQWDHPHEERSVIWRLASGPIAGAKGVPLLQN